MFAVLSDLSRVTSQSGGLADIGVMCSLGSEFGSTSSLAQEWRKLVDLCSDLQETDYDQTAASRYVILSVCPVESGILTFHLIPNDATITALMVNAEESGFSHYTTG